MARQQQVKRRQPVSADSIFEKYPQIQGGRMLRTDPYSSPPRVGAGTRSTRSGASNARRSRSVRGDAVEILEKRFGYFPQRFQWRGHAHQVQAVERTWTKMGRIAQLCFRVRCNEGVFDLTQNAKSNIWSLSVVQLNP